MIHTGEITESRISVEQKASNRGEVISTNLALDVDKVGAARDQRRLCFIPIRRPQKTSNYQ